MRVRLAPVALSVLSTLASPFATAHARELSLEERIRAQEAIERVYYSHQIGATKPFEEAVPREVLEKKVRTYLAQSAALERFWQTPVTAEALWRETERMARQSRLPERLEELHVALGGDVFLIQECLARPALVGRLTRHLFAFDSRIHRSARREAEEIRRSLASGAVGITNDHPRRHVMEIVRADGPMSSVEESHLDGSGTQRLRPEAYQHYRGRLPATIGEVGPVIEEGRAFVTRVLLGEEAGRIRFAEYRVPKITWDDWWGPIESGFTHAHVRVVADPARPLPRAVQDPASLWSSERLGGAQTACLPDDTWDNGILDEIVPTPEERTGHTAVWTGGAMIVWGGYDGWSGALNTGGRYDPATDTWTPTSTVGAPSPRSSHTAVWTGRTMVVWGGGGSSTGGRYEPLTDSWTPTSTVDAPESRAGHEAVWTGSRMVIWGGQSGVALGTGGRYDPETDTWTATSLVGAPEARGASTAVWTGTEMIVWGGVGATSALDTGGRYDPKADTWRPTATGGAPEARYAHTAVWTGSEMIVWGGSASFSAELNTGARYDPASDTWRPTTTVGAPDWRDAHTAVWTGTRMIVWGGANHYYDADEPKWTGGLYDPVADTWRATATTRAPWPRLHHTAVWTGTLMIVWGGDEGIDASGRTTGITHTGGRYDPEADIWTPTAIPPVRFAHSAVWTGSHMIIWGGFCEACVNIGERYDPATDTWSPTATQGAPAARYAHGAAWTGSVMVIWGGTNGIVSYDTGGRYDPIADAWMPTSTTGAPPARIWPTAVWTGDLLIFWGGYSQLFPHYVNTGGRYDPISDTWSPTSSVDAPTARSGHRAVWSGSRMIVWGGGTGSATFNTGGRYDPGTDSWTPTSTLEAPSARSGHSAVWTGTVMIVWGGFYSLNSGARYDPESDVWTPTPTLDAPSGRSGHSAVWTGTVMIVWGGSGADYLNTGGRYDARNDTWTPTSTIGAPVGRYYHSAVWTGSMMIVWGAAPGGGRYMLGQSVDDDFDGYSECAGDCNDMNPAIHPGAAEVCDGLDNDCDAVADNAPVPGGIPFLTVQPSGNDMLLSWSSLSQATGYDVVRGDLSILISSGGDFGSATQACLADDLGGTSLSVTDAPTTGGGFWYLVRAINCGGHGSYDSGGPAQVRLRDAGINSSTSSCP
jgi:N-acetylneuraminic acid mutarotase